MSFDTDTANVDLPAPTWTTKVQKTVSDYSSILRPVALLVLFMLACLFVLRPVQKHVLSTPQLAAPSRSGLARAAVACAFCNYNPGVGNGNSPGGTAEGANGGTDQAEAGAYCARGPGVAA